jgi:hypothetical protein
MAAQIQRMTYALKAKLSRDVRDHMPTYAEDQLGMAATCLRRASSEHLDAFRLNVLSMIYNAVDHIEMDFDVSEAFLRVERHVTVFLNRLHTQRPAELERETALAALSDLRVALNFAPIVTEGRFKAVRQTRHPSATLS